MLEKSDEAIAKEVQNGDREAFGFLIERYENKLKRYGRKFLNTKEDIEDKVQEVFIKSYTNIQSFDTSQKFSSWIYRIAHNEFVNELRKQQRRPFTLFDSDTILPLISSVETADGPTLDKEFKKMMEQYIGELDYKYREPLVLYFYEELSYQDIAEILQLPTTTVGVRINRAKEKLKTLYQNKNYE